MSSSLELQEREREQGDLVRLGSWAMTQRHNLIVEAVLKTLHQQWGSSSPLSPFFHQYMPFFVIRNLILADPIDVDTCKSIIDEIDAIEASCKHKSEKNDLDWNRIRFKVYEQIGIVILQGILQYESAPVSVRATRVSIQMSPTCA